MYLKRLELQGFKTFADKTVIDFAEKHGITAIVGPNGCGKSNLIDAFRWVMGEQSMKMLRGSNQEEIIFAGTENRKPVSLAEVTLTLDNSDSKLPVDFAEVQITRKYYRSGESEYYLNKQPALLREIQALLMDTGIGKGAYSIVSQGQVGEILNSKPESRRVFFEEAAGIQKYKNQKINALRKLAVTEQNLARLMDIRSEIHQLLEPLAEQAKDAIEYKKLKEELAGLEIGLYKEKIGKLNQLDSEIRSLTKGYQETINNSDQKTEELTAKKQEFRAKIVELEELLNQLRTELQELRSSQAKSSNELNVALERYNNLGERTQAIEQETSQLQVNRENLTAKQQEAAVEMVAAEKGVQELQQKMLNKSEENQTSFDSWQVINQNLNQLREELTKLVNSIENKKGNLLGLESTAHYTQGNIQRVEDSISKLQLRLTELNQKNEELEKRKNFVDQKIREVSLERDNLFKLRTSKDNDRKNLLQDYSRVKELFDSKSSRLKLLEEMQQTHEGFQKGVRSVLGAKREAVQGFAKIKGVIADLLVAPQKYEAALEAALENSLQGVVLEQQEEIETIIEYLKQGALGRATFLSLADYVGSQTSRPALNGVVWAIEVVECRSEYRDFFQKILGQTVIVETLSEALAKRHEYFAKGVEKIVTLSGEMFTAKGAIVGGLAHKEASSLLGRQREILDLQKVVKDSQSDLEQIEKKEKEINTELSQIEEDLKKYGKELNSLEVENGTLINDLARVSLDQEKSTAELAEITESKSENQQELNKVSGEKESVENIIRQLESQRSALQYTINDKENELRSAEKEKERASELLTEIKISITSAEANKRQIELKQESYRDSLQQTIGQIEQKIREKEQAELSRIQLAETIDNLQKNLPGYETVLAEKQAKIEAAELERSRLFNDLEVYDRLEKESNVSDREIRSRLAEEEIKLAKIEAELTEIKNRLETEYEMTVAEVLQSDKTVENFDAVNEEVDRLKRKIKRLEPVNLLAIEEYEAQKERLVFIERQCEDLQKSKDDLHKLIKELDQVAVKSFVDVFVEVNNHFKRLFVELFRGGEAELKIIDEDNVLESGVEIMAKVPGTRQAQSMNLLSGGQKALTAIALLFSLLSAKPGPFIILDEIDAALDDSNIVRVTEILKEFAKATQQIIITHRQPTMAIASTMFGVTMETKGISKLVSVKLASRKEEELAEEKAESLIEA